MQNRYLPVPMETRGIVAWWDPTSRVHSTSGSSTQSPHDVRTITSRITGVPENRIRVNMGDVGGGFGQKAYLARDEQIVMLASFHLGRPLKWIEDRHENLVGGHVVPQRALHGHASRPTTTARSSASRPTTSMRSAPYPHGGQRGRHGRGDLHRSLRNPEAGVRVAIGLHQHAAPRALPRTVAVRDDFREQAMDLLARQMGVDPLELRRRNVIHRDELPYTLPLGIPMVDISPEETLEQATAMIGYDEFRAEQRKRVRRGTTRRHRHLALHRTADADGRLQHRTAPHPGTTRWHRRRVPRFGIHGQGLETTTAQLVAEYLGVDYDDVDRAPRRHRETPYAFGTGGSRSGPCSAPPSRRRSRLREKVAELAAHLLEAAADDIEIVDGVACVRGTPARSRTIAEIARVAYLDLGDLPPGMEPGLEVLTATKPDLPFMYSNACHLCMVAIDRAPER